MTEVKSEIEQSALESSSWFSTYGLITARRILDRYKIILSDEELIAAMKSNISFYHSLLEVPLKNVLNGIVFEQASDYHIYAQKLFIDYLLSAEQEKTEDAQGASTRESLENERQALVALIDEFHKKELEHFNLIAASQASIIKITADFNAALEEAVVSVSNQLDNVTKAQVRKAIVYALTYCDLIDPQLQSNQFLFMEKMNEVLKIELNQDAKDKIMRMLDIVRDFKANTESYLEQAEEIKVQANLFRSQFRETILRVTELINILPEYQIDPVQDAVNREVLYFDELLGALSKIKKK